MADRPVDDGLGNRRAAPSTSPSAAAGQSVNVAGGWVRKQRAATGSLALWRICQNTDVQRDGGNAIADRPPDAGYGRPQACRRTWQDDRPTSQWSFLFPIEAD